ncbi:MAG: ATP-binding cassette domain-containing protein [Clostridia bacterium]|nr:ATP-binding cassette domain-containing protein [Clostridia bacterium]
MQDIVISHISKSFGEKRVLSDFSATLKAGGSYALMGASGIGKTTLLRILLSLENKDGGEITGVPTRIATVFQEDRLIATLSAKDNLRFVLGNAKDAEIEALLTELGLAESLSAPVSTLSGGMRRRVSLARALLFDAPLLLLDEPFKGLDKDTKLSAIQAVKKYSQGRTLLFVTHDQEEASLLDATILLLSPAEP